MSQFPAESSRLGEFVRQASVFRRHIGEAEFPAAEGRYHLYVSYACPWAHRTIIVRALKRLERTIGMTVVDPLRDDRGWAFTRASGPDPINGFEFLAEAYEATDPSFDGRATVPVLWDTESGQIVNNESSEIIRMLGTAFDAWGDASIDLYPQALRAEIDAVNDWVYSDINNGVYRCGFASTQVAYDAAFEQLFSALDRAERRLAETPYLCGDTITEADWRLFTTLVRFDAVYVGHFKCNLRRIADYPALSRLLRTLYAQPGIAESCNFDHIKRHYYMTHRRINPTGIVPRGPELELTR